MLWGCGDNSTSLYPWPRIVSMSRCDNTKFNLLRKRFATIGVAGAVFPTGLVSNCNNFFSSPDSAKIRGVSGQSGVVIKNSLSVNIRPCGSLELICARWFIILFRRSINSRA